jgi:hypothetical protein
MIEVQQRCEHCQRFTADVEEREDLYRKEIGDEPGVMVRYCWDCYQRSILDAI